MAKWESLMVCVDENDQPLADVVEGGKGWVPPLGHAGIEGWELVAGTA